MAPKKGSMLTSAKMAIPGHNKTTTGTGKQPKKINSKQK
jgi:hypothetical protein